MIGHSIYPRCEHRFDRASIYAFEADSLFDSARVPLDTEEIRIGRQEHPKIIKTFGGTYGGPELADYVAGIGQRLAGTAPAATADLAASSRGRSAASPAGSARRPALGSAAQSVPGDAETLAAARRALVKALASLRGLVAALLSSPKNEFHLYY